MYPRHKFGSKNSRANVSVNSRPYRKVYCQVNPVGFGGTLDSNSAVVHPPVPSKHTSPFTLDVPFDII